MQDSFLEMIIEINHKTPSLHIASIWNCIFTYLVCYKYDQKVNGRINEHDFSA